MEFFLIYLEKDRVRYWGAFVDSDIFNATNVFAKHDENYMPASIEEDLKETGYWNKKYK